MTLADAAGSVDRVTLADAAGSVGRVALADAAGSVLLWVALAELAPGVAVGGFDGAGVGGGVEEG